MDEQPLTTSLYTRMCKVDEMNEYVAKFVFTFLRNLRNNLSSKQLIR